MAFCWKKNANIRTKKHFTGLKIAKPGSLIINSRKHKIPARYMREGIYFQPKSPYFY
jgi:hypothetical protein